MNATEARQLRTEALHSKNGEVGQVLEKIYTKIATASKKALSSVDIGADLRGMNTYQRNAIHEQLQKNGFDLNIGGDQRDSYQVTSW